MILPIFLKNYMKLRKFWTIGGTTRSPLDPPLHKRRGQAMKPIGLSALPVADLRGCARDAPPRGCPNSFNFMQFLGKFGKIVCWRPPRGELAPLPRGNPGSATGCSSLAFYKEISLLNTLITFYQVIRQNQLVEKNMKLSDLLR